MEYKEESINVSLAETLTPLYRTFFYLYNPGIRANLRATRLILENHKLIVHQRGPYLRSEQMLGFILLN